MMDLIVFDSGIQRRGQIGEIHRRQNEYDLRSYGKV